MMVFEERGNCKLYMEKTSRCRMENQQTQPTYCMTPDLGIKPGPHWWEVSALTAAPPNNYGYYKLWH